MMKRLLLILLLCSTVQAANDFLSDPNCEGLWPVEQTPGGAVDTNDLSGNGNTLTNYRASTSATCMEGLASAYFGGGSAEEKDYLEIADASLSAGFPLKSGDTNKKVSVAFWYQPAVFPSSGTVNVIFSKFKSTTNERSFQVAILNTAGTVDLQMYQGHTEGTAEEIWAFTDLPLSIGRWYHVGATYDDATKTGTFRVWDDTAESVTTNSHVFTNSINIEAAAVSIGRRTAYDGGYITATLDEIVVFNDILNSAEIDAIRGGTYGASSSAVPVLMNSYRQRR